MALICNGFHKVFWLQYYLVQCKHAHWRVLRFSHHFVRRMSVHLKCNAVVYSRSFTYDLLISFDNVQLLSFSEYWSNRLVAEKVILKLSSKLIYQNPVSTKLLPDKIKVPLTKDLVQVWYLRPNVLQKNRSIQIATPIITRWNLSFDL